MAAYQSGHGSEVEGFAEHQLLEDVDSIKVLCVQRIFLKLLDILPVPQSQTDLHPGTKQKAFQLCVAAHLNTSYACYRPDLL